MRRWMASLTCYTWVWVSSGSWWWTGRPGMLQFMRSQRIRHDLASEQQQCYISLWGNSSSKHTHTHTHTHMHRSDLFWSCDINKRANYSGPEQYQSSKEACQVCSGYFSFLSLISHLKQMVISAGYPCLCVGKKTSKPMTFKRYFVYVCVCNLRLGRTSLSFFYLASPKIA